MCGISGIIGPSANEFLINQMLAAIGHRGDNDHGREQIVLENIAIGTNRLAIVDPNHGKQPFSTSAEDVFCILNGEIYNHVFLRKELLLEYEFKTKCDTEVILNAYLKWGENMLSKLDGMFSLCIVDLKKNKYLLARDHVGIKPLYYSIYNNSIFFSSEYKSFEHLSFINEIIDFEPGTSIVNGKTKKYYQLPSFNTEKNKINLAKYSDELAVCLNEAINKQLPYKDKKVAVLLSGGIDSSVVTYLVSRLHNNNLEAFTFTNPDDVSLDLNSAKQLCDANKILHSVVSASSQELVDFYLKYGVYMTETYETPLIRNAVSYYFLCRGVANKGYKFCLSGEGADELFGGYSYFQLLQAEYRDSAIYSSLRFIHKTYLQMADRASMFATLEVRVPYMDKKLINFVAALPSNCRIDGRQDKNILRSVFSKVLPSDIVNRPKMGMNQGAGFGSNDPGESIYFQGVKQFYERSNSLSKDRSIVEPFLARYKIDITNLEDTYNFARFIEGKINRINNSSQRLQLNTSKLLDNFSNYTDDQNRNKKCVDLI